MSLTGSINLMGDGDDGARAAVIEEAYPELIRIAREAHRRFPMYELSQSHEVLSEAWLKVSRLRRSWADRTHFFSTFASAVRSVRRDALRRRGVRVETALDGVEPVVLERGFTCLESDFEMALERIESEHPLAGKILEMRIYLGFTHDAVADDLDIPVSKVKTFWAMSLNRLRSILRDYGSPE